VHAVLGGHRQLAQAVSAASRDYWFAEKLGSERDAASAQGYSAESGGFCREMTDAAAVLGEGGDGYAPGEGAGVAVLLVPLTTKAIADGDHVYAVVRGQKYHQSRRENKRLHRA